MISAARLRNRSRRKGWIDDHLSDVVALLDALCPVPGLWDCGERRFHTDLPRLSMAALIAERQKISNRLLYACDTERLPWLHERLERIDRELARRDAA